MCGLNVYFGEDPSLIASMSARSEHRGVRSQTKTYFDGVVHVNHWRLPVQGLSEKWDNPLTFPEGDVAMVGEVLNFRSFDRTAENDVVVVGRRWFTHQINPISSLYPYDGFWAILFVDDRSLSVTLVIDPLAKKPMYAAVDHEGRYRALSSEIAPLLKIWAVNIDHAHISGVRKWGYCMDGSTPYRGIRSMPPGTATTFDSGGRLVRQVYYGDKILKPERSAAGIYTLIYEAVLNRLVADIPICLFVSGGMDSAIIFEHARLKTHDITLLHLDNGEEEYLNLLDIPSDIRVVKVSATSTDFDISQESMFRANQSPVDLGSVLPQFVLGQAAARLGFQVALSGDGADELFGGYARIEKYDSQMSDIFHELVYYHLPRLDRMMMASTVELRCPFLSWKVVNHAISLSWRNRLGKIYLKNAYRGIISNGILDRKKTPLRVEEMRRDREKFKQDRVDQFLWFEERDKI